MQVSVSTTGSLGRRVEVAVPATEVEREVDERLKKISRTAKLKGFRPGKVPFAVIRQQFGEQVQSEVVSEMVRTSFAQALDEQKLRPAGRSKIEPISAPPRGDLKYAAEFEVLPEFQLKPLDSIQVERIVSVVQESDVDAMIETMRRQRPVYTPVERPAQKTDRLTLDYAGRIDGEPFPGSDLENQEIVLGSGKSFPEIEAGLTGAAAGEDRTIAVSFPQEQPNKALAGRTAQIQFHIKQVEEASPSPLDEEFCRAYGVQDGSVETLRQEVRKSMEHEVRGLIRGRMYAQVIDALYQQNPIEVPRALIEEQLQQMQVEAGRRLGVRDPSQLPPRGPFEEPARRRAAISLILAQIVQAEELKVDPERVQARVDDLAAKYDDPGEARRALLANPEHLRQIQSSVLEEQALDWVTEHGQVTERTLSFAELTGFGREAGDPTEKPT